MGPSVDAIPGTPPNLDAMQKNSWRLSLVLGVCVAVLAGWAYFHCLFLFFAQDDFWMLSHAQQTNHALLLFFKGIFPEYVRPITTCWMPCLLYFLGGVDPLIYKIAQLAAFLISLGVLWLLLRELIQNTLAAWLGSIVFAFSPVHVYTLGWFAGIIDNLFLLFFISALLLLARCVTRTRWSGTTSWLLVAVYSAALFSKENGILLLPIAYAVVGAVTLTSRRWPTRQEIGGLCGMTLLTVAYLIFRKIVVVSTAGTLSLCLAPNRAFVIWRYAIESVPLVNPVYLVWYSWLPAVVVVLFALTLGYLGRSLWINGWRWDHARLFLTIGLGFSLFVLNVAIFAFQPQPAVLVNYYSTLCVAGIALLFSGLLAWLMRVCSHRLLAPLIALLLGVYAWQGAVKIHDLVVRGQSPSLFLAGKAQFFYGQIRPHIEKSKARTIVIRGADELTWWASGKGYLIPVMFHGKLAYFPEFDAARQLAPPFLELILRADGTVKALDSATYTR